MIDRARASRSLKIVGAALGAVVLLVGGAEAIARLTTTSPPVVALDHPWLGHVRPPGLRIPKLDIETGEPFVLEFDALGFRGQALQKAAKAPGTYRIFFVGASTTENAELPEAATFPGLVEAKLNERLEGAPRVEVGNAGTPGADSAHSLALVALRILELEPDLVVVLEATSTDLQDSLQENWVATTAHLAHEPETTRARDWLTQHSRLVALWDARFGGRLNPDPRQNAIKRLAARRKRKVLEPTFDIARGIPAFARHQERLVRLCKAEGVAVALMTQPTLLKPQLTPEEDAKVWATVILGTDYNLEPATLLRAIEAYNDATRATATREGALLIDLGKLVPRETANFADDFHLTRRGNAAIAEIVVAELLKTGQLPKERARNDR